MASPKSSRFSKGIRLVVEAAFGEARRALGLDPSVQPTARLAIERWLGALGPVPPERGRVLITALRSRTWVEWAAYSACVLRRRGWTTTLLYRSSQVTQLYNEPGYFNFWFRVRDIPGIELVDLDALPVGDIAPAYRALAEDLAPACIAYDCHVEEADVNADRATYGSRVAALSAECSRSAAALECFLRSRPTFHRFLCYSGLIAESPGLLAAARKVGQETFCLEGWSWRPGHMIYNRNAPALEYNVRGWMAAGGGWTEEKEREIDRYLKFLDGETRSDDWLDNFYRIQRAEVSAKLPPHVRKFVEGDAPLFLCAPNVIGDSSMLRRETIFAGMRPWLCELIAWFRARPHLKLVIRAHPAEVWVGAKCALHVGAFAREEAAGAANILVIDATEPTNTFSLLPFARAGLVWISSAGVDFPVRGLPCMAAGRPKYTGLGVVEEPASREIYFATLARWAESAPRPSAEQIRAGKQFLHMVFKGFSFEAGSRTYYADQLFLGAMPSQEEHDRFFSILIGESPQPDGVS
jgi:hypothetical protein